MKKKKGILVALTISTLFMAGCLYEAPLSAEHAVPIDPALLGLWENIPKPGDTSEPDRMIVLMVSETEYFIHHPANDGGMYFRGYPIEVEGETYVQTKVIGTKSGALSREIKKVYHVVSFTVADDSMDVRMLNPKVISPELKTSEELRKAFLKNINHPELLEGPIRFRRCVD